MLGIVVIMLWEDVCYSFVSIRVYSLEGRLSRNNTYKSLSAVSLSRMPGLPLPYPLRYHGLK